MCEGGGRDTGCNWCNLLWLLPRLSATASAVCNYLGCLQLLPMAVCNYLGCLQLLRLSATTSAVCGCLQWLLRLSAPVSTVCNDCVQLPPTANCLAVDNCLSCVQPPCRATTLTTCFGKEELGKEVYYVHRRLSQLEIT
jgi:hypothetical protein